jgi:hypothetical protein
LAGAAGTAPVVGQYLSQGEGDSFWVARYDDVVRATFRAAEKLSLELKQKEIEESSTKLHLYDDRGKEIVLFVEHRTDTVTRVHFDTGSREFSGVARLLARQIVQELKDEDAFLVNWSDEGPSGAE